MNTVKIGWAKRDVSTTEPVNINGQMYLRISEGIFDPITVTALVLDGGSADAAAIFLSCDVTLFYGGLVRAVQEAVLEKDPTIPIQNLAMNATHTHSSSALYASVTKSPDGKDIYPAEQYKEFFVDMASDAICEAWKNRSVGGIAYGYGYAVVGHSRRTVYFEDQSVINPNAVAPNGHGVMYGNTAKQDFSHYEAGADHFLNVMFTVDADKKLTGMVINVPCPSQTSENFTQLSADYWHDVREAIAGEFGPEVYVLAQCAAAGDLAPRTLHYKQAQVRRMALKYGIEYDLARARMNDPNFYKKAIAERKDIAERILQAVKEIHSWAMSDIHMDVPIRHVGKILPISRRLITDEEKKWCEDNIAAMEAAIPDPEQSTPEEYRIAMTRYQSVKGRNNRAIARHREQQDDPTYPCDVQITQVGDIAFVSNPFELYQDYMHRIQARSPFIQTFVTQLTNNYGGYLPTVRGAANKGYSASIFCNQVGPEGGQELVEYTLKVLKNMKNDQHQ